MRGRPIQRSTEFDSRYQLVRFTGDIQIKDACAERWQVTYGTEKDPMTQLALAMDERFVELLENEGAAQFCNAHKKSFSVLESCPKSTSEFAEGETAELYSIYAAYIIKKGWAEPVE